MNNTINQIIVYGAGGVGGYFGGLLARGINKGPAGVRQVNFIARGEHLKAIQTNGLIVKTGDGGEFRAFPNTASHDPTPLPQADLLLLCVKSYDLDAALECLGEKIGHTTIILPLMNGVDIGERIERRLDRGIVLPTCVYVSSRISAPGEITQTGPEGIILTGNKKGMRDVYPEEILKIALESSLNIQWQENPEYAVWRKYLFIAPFALVTAARRQSIGEVLNDPDTLSELKGVMAEVIELGTLRGIPFSNDDIDVTLSRAADFPLETRTSFQQDVEARRAKTEIELFGGTLQKMGRELGINTPFTDNFTNLLGNVSK